MGANSRLDEIQAGLLRIKLKHMEELNEERKQICNKYLSNIKNNELILPEIDDNVTTVWHQFVIRTTKRKELIEYLEQHDIGSIIHYPIPPHLAEAYQYLGYRKGDYPVTEKYADEVLSLPLYNGMRKEQDYVIEILNQFG